MTARVLLTGATGYIGGRLVRPLVDRGVTLRCMARDGSRLERRVPEAVEIAEADVLDPSSLEPALEGVDTAYYLIHSMGSTDEFAERDREGASNFARAAAAAGVERIVYLGGLGQGPDLSDHLESRQEVGRILRRSGVPTVELRASIIIGSGSLSFELIRALVERLPVMITPQWVRTQAQPIAVEDVVAYLVEALDAPFDLPTEGRIYEIGGADRVGYGTLMETYARLRGLRRAMIPVPVLTPRLSSLWLGLVTPVYARIGKKLVDGLRNPTVVEDDRALEDFSVEPRGVEEAVRRALVYEDRAFARTRWSDALSSGGEGPSWGGRTFGSRKVDSRFRDVNVAPPVAFAPIRRIGGDVGWYFADFLWRIRGFMDLLVGGVGMRRGRRDPERPTPGDALDFWRVEEHVPDRLLRLSAEMKLPGRAWLQFEVEERPSGSRIRQTALFDPLGLAGLVYWYGLYPAHALIFRGMIRRIAAAAEELERKSAPETSRAQRR